jgi:hypothetical protein
MIPILKAGVLYFVLVFGVGFVLGPIRVMWAAPRFGTMAAELMEMPLMLAAIILAARFTVRRLAVPSTPLKRLGVGCIALGLLLMAEVTVVLSLQGLSIQEYIEGREPVSGVVYLVMLLIFAIMPLLVLRSVNSGFRPAAGSGCIQV